MGIPNLFQDPRIGKCLYKNLHKVKYLDVQLLRYPLSDPFATNLNMDIILSNYYPALKSFKLCFSLWGNYVQILNFLKKHASTLQELELQVGESLDAKNTEIFLRSNRSQDRRVREVVDIQILASLKLTKFVLRDDVLNTNPTVALYFLEVLEQFTTLKYFQMYSPGEMTMQNMKNIVSNNETNLEEYVVYNIKNPVTLPSENNGEVRCVPLDMTIFQKCINLKRLELACNTTHKEDGLLGRTIIKLTNLHLISTSIERMCLTGFQLDLQDVVDWSINAKKLSELLIVDAGPMQYSGLLACLIRNCVQLKYLNVRPIMTRDSDDAVCWSDLEGLSKIYNHFMGITFDPTDDLDGFEARITDQDRKWISENVKYESVDH